MFQQGLVNFFILSSGSVILDVVSEDKYLGLIVNEFVDYNVSVKYIANHVNGALGHIIAKGKYLGGLPFLNVSINCLVLAIMNYNAAVWGHRNVTVLVLMLFLTMPADLTLLWVNTKCCDSRRLGLENSIASRSVYVFVKKKRILQHAK